MKITTKFLKEKRACKEGMKWVTDNKLIGLPDVKFIQRLIEAEKLSWANWLIVRVMTHSQQIMYAIFSAEQVIGIYEAKYPNDNRPRKAIEAAKAYLKNPTDENKKNAAAAAADAAYATYAAYAAANAANAAANAANAAANAAYADAAFTDAAFTDAAFAAADAYAGDQMRITILNYGMTLISKP